MKLITSEEVPGKRDTTNIRQGLPTFRELFPFEEVHEDGKDFIERKTFFS